jgi:hypothetical protein
MQRFTTLRSEAYMDPTKTLVIQIKPRVSREYILTSTLTTSNAIFSFASSTRAAEFEFECGVTRRGRDFKLQSLCPHSTISRPGSKLLSFSWLYRSELSLDLRATRLEQGRRDLKPQVTQLITLNNSLNRIENSHNIL